jgi:hypothetical protein
MVACEGSQRTGWLANLGGGLSHGGFHKETLDNPAGQALPVLSKESLAFWRHIFF